MKNAREYLVAFFVFLLTAILIVRLFFLQIVKGNYYRALSFGIHNNFSLNNPRRGEVFFRGGEPLALNREYFFVFVLPEKIKDKEKTSEKLAQILSLDKEFVLKTITDNRLIAVIKRKLCPEEIEKIKKEGLEGVYLETENQRYYPQEETASNIIGFVNRDGKGEYGIEGMFDKILDEGKDLILTIDFRVQKFAEKLLKKAKDELKIEGGQILVLEPDTGKILTMANYPNFNPNRYADFANNLEIFKNPATQNLFEPGSVLKPITMAIALEEGKITPETTYRDPGEIRVQGWTIRNYDNRVYPGDITMREVLEKSINTGAVFVKKQVENNVFLNYLKSFGFFEKTGVDFPETFSENKELRQGKEVNLITASFGQGVAITPLQLAKIYCAIANGGKLVTPYLIENLREQKESPQVLSSKTTIQLTSMLVSVVENGFGKRAKITGYYIGGKTGTSLQPYPEKRGYSEKTWQTFIGYFPAYHPKFLILVKLDNPKTKTAEYSAAPIFRELAEFIIRLYQIPPDYE